MIQRSTNPLPEAMSHLSPHLVCASANEAIAFYKAAFDAVELMRLPGPDGKLMHASVDMLGCSVSIATPGAQPKRPDGILRDTIPQ